MASGSIYGLYDKAGNLRYIGKANNPVLRLNGHMRDCQRRDTPVYRWIRKNGPPDMRVLEANCVDWKASERKFIAEARLLGANLLNVAEGGDEPYCSTEVRARNGKANAALIHGDPKRKRLWALKRDMGQALKAGHVSQETRAKLRVLAARQPETFGAWLNV